MTPSLSMRAAWQQVHDDAVAILGAQPLGRLRTDKAAIRQQRAAADRIRVTALAQIDALNEAEAYSCAITGELVSIDDADIYERPGHRIEPDDGCVWTEDAWCDCTPLRVAVIPDPAVLLAESPRPDKAVDDA